MNESQIIDSNIYRISKYSTVNIEEISGFFLENDNYDIFSKALRKEVEEIVSGKTDFSDIFSIKVKERTENQLSHPEGYCTYLFCNLFCEEDYDVCCYIFAQFFGKVWLDNELLTVGSDWINSACKIKITKGFHTLVMETLEWNPPFDINIRFTSLESELANSYSSFLNRNHMIKSDILILHNSNFINQHNPFKIMLVPIDKFKYKTGEKILVKYGHEDSPQKYEKEILIGESAELPFDAPITDKELLINLPIEIYSINGTEPEYQCAYCLLHKSANDTIISYYKRRYDPIIKNEYISALDGKEEYYNICLPNNYDSTKKYPLFVQIATGYSRICQTVCAATKYSAIAVDITAKGVTTGSYVGEAAIFEAIDLIKSRYSVDDNKIYLTGRSNGGAACWAIAQAYPHLFAGIFVFSGVVNTKKLSNLDNMRIINVSSPYEYMYKEAWEVPNQYLQNNPNYKGVLIEGLSHLQIKVLKGKEIIYEDLLRHSIEAFPREINYFTSFNRHLRSYWISIHSIAFGAKEAEIHATATEDLICVEAVNVSGLTLRLPPYVNKQKFKININGVQYTFKDFTEDKISFSFNQGASEIIECNLPCDYRKGMGLLDVFTGPLEIVRSEFENSDKVSSVFAEPTTNGYNPKIYISYPVFSVCEIDSIPSDKNLIIIDNNSDSEVLKELRSLCPIKMTDEGYEYKGVSHPGPYCIMQVFAHPEDHKKSVLYINANDGDLYRKNFFTRTVITPSYINTQHPYINNVALIFDGEKYYRIYEWDSEIEIVQL